MRLVDERELNGGAEVLLSLMSQYLELGGEREPGAEVGTETSKRPPHLTQGGAAASCSIAMIQFVPNQFVPVPLGPILCSVSNDQFTYGRYIQFHCVCAFEYDMIFRI